MPPAELIDRPAALSTMAPSFTGSHTAPSTSGGRAAAAVAAAGSPAAASAAAAAAAAPARGEPVGYPRRVTATSPTVDGTGGLTTAEVAERVARGEVNTVARGSSRSVREIVRANVFTPFNLIVGTCS